MNRSPAIEVRDLRIARGGRLVLRDVSVDVAAGLVTAFWARVAAASRP